MSEMSVSLLYVWGFRVILGDKIVRRVSIGVGHEVVLSGWLGRTRGIGSAEMFSDVVCGGGSLFTYDWSAWDGTCLYADVEPSWTRVSFLEWY